MLKDIAGRGKHLWKQIIIFGRRHKKQIAAATLGIVILQLLYPSNLTKPLVFSSGKYLGLSSNKKVENYYRTQIDRTLAITIGNEKKDLKLADVGITIDEQKAMTKAGRDAIWQRFIPLSILWPISIDASSWQSVDREKLNKFSSQRSQEYYRPAKSAGAARSEAGVFVLTPSEKGRQVNKEDVATSITQNRIESSQTINIAPQIVEPNISDIMVNEVIEKTKLANLPSIVFEVTDKSYKISPEIINPWLTIEIDEAKKQARLGYDDGAINAWIDSTIAVVNSGKPAVITLRDGVEISKTEGAAGRGVDKKKALADIKASIENKQPKITGEIVALPIARQVIRTYSATNNGLSILIEEWFKEYPGMEAGVYLRELSGRGLSAEKNANNAKFAASVYKLWVAQFVLEKTDLNQIAYDDKTYGQCLDLMIRVSNNDCPHKIIDKHGGSTMNAYVAGNGFGSTSLTNNTTSPRDAGRFLERLFSGSLLDSGKTNQLLGLLRSQIYRAGVPAGSPGATVADKPGFYGDSWHDAAIVQGPSSTYVLVVMTKGSGVLSVKTLAQRIYQTLN